MRLKDKTAIIVGAGQSPGTGMGNGRATALRFAQEGARIMSVDRELALAEETAALVRKEGGDCFAYEADVGQLCSIDMISVIQRGAAGRGPRCSLGKFVPVRYAEAR